VRRLLAVLVVPLLLLLAGETADAATPAGDVRFVLVGRVEDPAITLVATGAITGIGSLSAETVDYHPADKTYHETDVARLGAGTLTLSIDGAFDVWPFDLDPATCTQHGSLAGTWTITAATGTHAGTTGGGTLSGRFVTYADPVPSGCDGAIRGFAAGSMVGTVVR
jgi:hypothetical protein